MAWGKGKKNGENQNASVDDVRDDAAVEGAEYDSAPSGFAAKFKAFQTRFKFDSLMRWSDLASLWLCSA